MYNKFEIIFAIVIILIAIGSGIYNLVGWHDCDAKGGRWMRPIASWSYECVK